MKKKILIVDDDKSLRILYEKEFAEDGYDVLLAASGKEAIEKLGENPDVIVMDIKMPGMNGIETIGKILSINRGIPIIINSAYSVYKNNFLTWPATSYVIKSSDLTELKESISSVLN